MEGNQSVLVEEHADNRCNVKKLVPKVWWLQIILCIFIFVNGWMRFLSCFSTFREMGQVENSRRRIIHSMAKLHWLLQDEHLYYEDYGNRKRSSDLPTDVGAQKNLQMKYPFQEPCLAPALSGTLHAQDIPSNYAFQNYSTVISSSFPVKPLESIYSPASLSPSASSLHIPPPLCGKSVKCLLVLFTSISEHASLSNPVVQVLHMMHLFQHHFSCRGVLLIGGNTRSPIHSPLLSLAHSLNILTAPHSTTNLFGLPLLHPMIKDVQSMVRAEYYAYVNSDILVDEYLFQLLESISRLRENGVLTKEVMIASRVRVRDSVDVFNVTDVHSVNYSLGHSFYYSIAKYQSSMRYRANELRHFRSADMLIYSEGSPTEYLSRAVIGRAGIDNIAMSYTAYTHMDMVDITHATFNIHLGGGSHAHKKNSLSDLDFGWNYCTCMKEKCALQDLTLATFSIRMNGTVWNVHRNLDVHHGMSNSTIKNYCRVPHF